MPRDRTAPALAGLPRRAVLAAAGLALLPASPARAAPVVDARGRRVAVTDTSRLVCIGGTITEIVYALGAAPQIVAVDSTSLFPAAALREKRNVGYMRALSAEGVLAVGPSLLLVMQDAGPPAAIETLLSANAPLLFVDATPTPQAVTGRVRFLAAVLGRAARGEELCAGIERGFADLAAWRAAHPGGARVLFVLSLRNGRPIVAGTGTAADAIIGLAGGVNAAATLSGYKPVSDEALATLAPDVVLAMAHGGAPIEAGIFDTPGFRLTPAAQHRRLIRMDGEFLLGFGPRTPEAALDLARHLAGTGQPA